ncbi:MAG: fructose-bisphosphatase class III [Faecalibacterium prausnitzii]
MYPLRDHLLPTVDLADPAALNPGRTAGAAQAGAVLPPERKLQQHVEFLYAKGSVYHIENGNLLYHGAVPMTTKGGFAVEQL